MADRKNSNDWNDRDDERRRGRYESERDDGEISHRDINRFAEDAFRKGASALSKADYDKPTKFLGFFEMDAGLASMFSSALNVGSDFLSRIVAPKAQILTQKYGAKAGLSGNTLTRTAALAAFSTEVVLKSGGFFGPVWNGYRQHSLDQQKIARALAPVLDDIKGRHSTGTFKSVNEADNEVIYAHRRRMVKIAGAENMNNWLNLGVNAGPNLLLNTRELKGMWQGESIKDIRAKAKLTQAHPELPAGDGSAVGEAKLFGRMAMNGLTGPIAERWIKSNEHKLNKTLQPYSALEMILELEEQVASKPDARSFQLPKSFQNPNRRGESYQLEEYIVRILIQHQKDMADISPDHTEIREALKDDLAAVAKPVAAAIRKGDMSALELVRLVGEGKIIRNRGRAIASPEEVIEAIRHDEPKQEIYAQIDPKEYWAQENHRREDAKEALSMLDGAERETYIALRPHVIRQEIGVTEKESAAVDAAIGPDYDRKVAELVMGVNAESPEQMKKDGLAQGDIKLINHDAALIEKKGLAAVHEFKNSPANDHGIEQVLSNWAVTTISGDKEHFGKVMADGQAQIAAMTSGKANDNGKDEVVRTLHSKGREPELRGREEGHERLHAEREAERRMTGTHDRHVN